MEISKTVKDVINEWDPMDLLALGAPEDEYNIEVKEILNILPKVKDETELGEAIKDIFDRYFSTDFEPIVCYQVAALIWEKLPGK